MVWNIIYFILPVIFLGLILWSEKEEKGNNTVAWFTIMCSMWALTAFDLLIEYNTPTRGETTLEITYRDSVAIDSTVVYKVKR